MNENDLEMKMATAVTEASGTMATLYLLRGSRVAQAMELLEQELDSSVVRLSDLARRLTTSDRERVVQTLRSIRDYRRLYSHRPTAEMEGIPEALITNARKVQEQATDILDQLT